MTEYSNNFFDESDPALITKFEDMLRTKESYFFDVEEIEALADHYLEIGMHAKARKAVTHGLELFPKSSALLLKKAQTLLIGKRPRKAMEILDFLEAAEPTNTEMLLFKAVVHRNLSDHEGTKSCLLKALNSSSENKEDIFLDLAFEQEMVEDYEGAIQSLIQSLEINPNHEASLFELCYCFDMAQDVETGVDYFNAYLNENPYSFVGWYNLAICFEKLGLFEKALESVGFCLAIKDDFTNAFILQGNLHTSCDEDGLAIDAYTQSLLHDESNPMVYAAIGECYERLESWDHAEKNYMRALALDPKYVDALMGLGAVRENEINFTASLKLYREALDYDELNMDNWHIYAETLVKAGYLREAEQAYLHMSENFESDEEIWIALSEVKVMLYNIGEGIQALKDGIATVKEAQDLHWHIVKLLLQRGELENAAELLTDCLHKQPEGSKYFLNIFPESIQFPNIVALIELYTQAKS